MKILFFEIVFSKKLYKLLFFTLVGFVIFYFSQHNILFWDNVLFVSKFGNHLYTTSVFNWNIPDSFDPGHPPFLASLLALAWKLLGHKLWVSHLVMLPFSVGLLYQLQVFVSYYVKTYYLQFFALLLLLLDPSLSAQFVQVNPEITILFLFFLAINSILYQRYYLKIIALFFLSVVSLRSMMLAGGIFLFEFINLIVLHKQKIKSVLNSKFILSYVIGSIPGVSFLIWHFLTKGWLQTHPDSPWGGLRALASPMIFFKNSIILAHRYLDFGRVFLILFIFVLILKLKKDFFTKEIKQLLLLSVSSVFFIIVTSLAYTNTIGHRYFIVSYITIGLLSFLSISYFVKRKKIIYILLLLGLITGNLWIYPRTISQGWDASLAYLPYRNLRVEAMKYMEKEHIQFEETATFFPNDSSPIDNIDLSGNMQSFESYTGKNKYIFYANVYNLTDEQYQNIDKNYSKIKGFTKFNIHIYLYKRNHDETNRR